MLESVYRFVFRTLGKMECIPIIFLFFFAQTRKKVMIKRERKRGMIQREVTSIDQNIFVFILMCHILVIV